MIDRTPRSLARQRHELIVSEVRRKGAARVADLADTLGVSEMTVRRDLEVLDKAGLVAKVHGGATIRYSHSTDEPGFEAKSLQNLREKTAIASSCAALTVAGAAIGITAGTTTVQLAVELINISDLTVVTNSIRVADVFHANARTDRTVVLTGGVRTPSDALVGPVSIGTLRSFHLDTVFMGIHGMHDRAGLTTPNLLEADTNRAFIETSNQLMVLADHSKWGVTGLSTIAALSEADVCVTDSGISDEARAVLSDHVGRLIVAAPDRGRTRVGVDEIHRGA